MSHGSIEYFTVSSNSGSGSGSRSGSGSGNISSRLVHCSNSSLW